MTGKKNRIMAQLVNISLTSLLSLSLIAATLCCPVIVSAQQEQEETRERREQVTIVGTYDPSINQAYKINTRPETNNLVLEKPEFTFTSLDVVRETTIDPREISPATIRTGSRTRVYNNFVKAGFGSQLSPLLEFFHSSGDKNEYRLNINLNHYSSFQDIPEYAPGSFSNSVAGIGFEKYNRQTILSIGAGFGFDTYRYYGYQPEEYPEFNPEEDDLRQSFSLVRLDLGIRSDNTKREALEYQARLKSYYFFDRWDKNETDIDLFFDLAKPFRTADQDDFQKFGIEVNVEYGINNDSVMNSTDLLLEGLPYFKARYGLFSFHAGLRFSYLVADSSVFRFYPDVYVAVSAIPEALTIYAGAGGGMLKNTYYRMTRTNPWVNSTVPVVWVNNKMRVYAGIRGNIARQLAYQFEIGWQSFENMPFFINTNDSQLWSSDEPLYKFTLVTDQGSLLKFSGELTYSFAEKLKVWLNGHFSNYSLDNISKPYHEPISRVALGGSYLLKQKVNFWGEFFITGKRYAFDPASSSDLDLDGYADVNLGIDYHVAEKLTIFVNGTNLLNSGYQRFYNYPVQGLQVMAGIGFRF